MRAVRNIPVAVAFAFVLALALAACADDDESATTTSTEAGARPAVDLKIEIAASADDAAPSKTWTLRCSPGGGSWPSVGPACERLTAEVLSPIRVETRDLQQITDQPVRISGRAFGSPVSLAIPAQGSGTRLARLRALRAALGAGAFDEAQRRSR
jgi:hypothetical protein